MDWPILAQLEVRQDWQTERGKKKRSLRGHEGDAEVEAELDVVRKST